MTNRSLESPILSALIRAGHDQFLKHARTKTYLRKEFLFAEGDPADAVFIIKKGTVRLVKQDPSGRDRVIGIYGPGDALGIPEVVNESPFGLSAVARTKVLVTRFPSVVLLELAKTNAKIGHALGRDMTRNILELQRSVEFLSVGRAHERIANLLVTLARKWEGDSPGEIGLPLTRQEIADMAGVTVETCIRTISKFRSHGLVQMLPRKKMLIDQEALASAPMGAA